MCQLLLHKLGWGIEGLAFAQAITNTVTLAIILVFIFRSKKIRPCLQPLNGDSFKSWSVYIKYTLPTVVMCCAEWWAFEVLTVLAGILGVKALVTQTICL